MNRITPEIVIAAYWETGRRPIRNAMNIDNGACGIGVCCVVKYPAMKVLFCNQIAHLLGVTEDYILGFTDGFDGRRFDTGAAEGYADGRACWEAVKDWPIVSEPCSVPSPVELCSTVNDYALAK